MRNIPLSPSEQALLYTLELDAEYSASEVASSLGVSAAQGQRALRKFQDREVILGQAAVLDVARLGLFEWSMLLAKDFQRAQQRAEFEKNLLRRREVSWIARSEGTYTYLLTILARTPHDAFSIFSQIGSSSQGDIGRRVSFARIERFRLRSTYSVYAKPSRLRFHLGASFENQALSVSEKRILQAMEQGAFWSLRDIAQRTGLHVSSVSRCIQRLKDTGLLQGFVYRLDRERLGLLQFRIYLRTRTPGPATTSRLLGLVSRFEETRLLASLLGPWDYEIAVDLQNHRQLSTYLDEIQERAQGLILETLVIPVFKQLKLLSFPAL